MVPRLVTSHVSPLALLVGCWILAAPGPALAADAPTHAIRDVLAHAGLVSAHPSAPEVLRDLLEGGLAADLAAASREGANEFLAAELFPHNRGAYVEFRDGPASFRRTLARRDFHHNGIRLLVHRSREGAGYDFETYQIGGGIGVRQDSVAIGEDALSLEPAVQLLGVRPRLGDTFSTTPAALHPATGRRMTWTCRTVALELLDLEDGDVVPSVAVETRVTDAGEGTELARFRTWYGDNMAIARRQGDFFGTPLDERARGRLVLPRR